jgi:hypothetical protein
MLRRGGRVGRMLRRDGRVGVVIVMSIGLVLTFAGSTFATASSHHGQSGCGTGYGERPCPCPDKASLQQQLIALRAQDRQLDHQIWQLRHKHDKHDEALLRRLLGQEKRVDQRIAAVSEHLKRCTHDGDNHQPVDEPLPRVTVRTR